MAICDNCDLYNESLDKTIERLKNLSKKLDALKEEPKIIRTFSRSETNETNDNQTIQ